MKYLIAIGLALSATIAHADQIKLASMDMDCVEDGVSKPVKFSLMSSPLGSEVILDGKLYEADQLTGGTEGGDPYLQTVNNNGGYNITISGGDFQKAFESGVMVTGTAKASVNLFKKVHQFTATCTGRFDFSPMPSALPSMPAISPAKTVTATCVPDARRVSSLLMAATDELMQMKAEKITLGTNVTCEQIDKGVVEYQFTYINCGLCFPLKTGVLTVQQDERPMYADGSPIYKKNLTYK